MFQRIQTLYTIISLIFTLGLYLWFPEMSDEEGTVVLNKNQPLILGLLAGSAVLHVLALMNFKKRQRQFVLNRLTIILNFVLLGVFVYRSLTLSGESLLSMKGIGVLFPAISIVLLAMANKAIKRDEDLVKSVDRIR
ncbi:DUF4293 domain-containing protein [Aureitalea marina]|uniref:Transcription termination factor Rho n=1 Tax=Aureitalea marina TaxID=930804 RepID=A0A2S7KMC6_9FLAO|nr:DUF4293 domain-containing protein [Aureitalea marina]PQB03784.1 hypothetical protein BST85_01845 [Aureitalea marina]